MALIIEISWARRPFTWLLPSEHDVELGQLGIVDGWSQVSSDSCIRRALDVLEETHSVLCIAIERQPRDSFSHWPGIWVVRKERALIHVLQGV